MSTLQFASPTHTAPLDVLPAAPTSLFQRVTVGAAGPLFGAVFASTAGLHPTGDIRADLFWSAVLGGSLGLVASRAQPSMWIACSLLTLLAESTVAAAAGFGLAVVGLWNAYQSGFMNSVRSDIGLRLMAAVAGVCAVVLLLGLRDLGAPRTSAAITLSTFLILTIAAFLSLPRSTKRGILVLGVAGFVIIAIAGYFEFRHLQSLEMEVRKGEALAQTAVSALRSGDYEEGLEALAETEAVVSGAAASFSRPEGRVLRFAPAVGVNANVLSETLSATQSLLESILELGDPHERMAELFQGGKVDPRQLDAFQRDALKVVARINELDRSTSNLESVWLAPSLTASLRSLDSDVDEAVAYSDRVETAASGLPGILGMDGPRSYLVLFGNPAEARELGGITGGTGVITLDQGELSVQPVARRAPNRAPATAAALTEAVPVRFLEHRPWQWEPNYTAMADFPTLSRALSDVFPAMGGQQVDGAIYLDPFALEAIVAITGPIRIDSLRRDVRAEEIPELLMVDQYELYEPGDEREQLFVDLFAGVSEAVKRGDFRLDRSAITGLTDMIRQDRLLLAPLDTAELAAADSLGLIGAIGDLGSNDYLAVSHLNSGGNKLDTYLHRAVSYEVGLDPTSDSLTAVVEVELRNTAPRDLPEYAAGAVDGLPGTARVTLVVHTPHELVEWRGLAEEPELVRSFREFGRWRHEASVHIPPGQQRIVSVVLSGTHVEDDYVLDIGHQPLVTNDEVDVAVVSAPGQADIRRELILTEDTTLEFDR